MVRRGRRKISSEESGEGRKGDGKGGRERQIGGREERR